MPKSNSDKATSRWAATNSEGYPAPVGLAVDVVVITVRDARLRFLVIERPEGPTALPGGFVGETESADQTAERKLREKTGLKGVYLEQLASFTRPDRDPRGWIPTVAYLALVPPETQPTDSTASWASATHRPDLAFDHSEILATALERVVGKLWWSNIAVGILPDPFTIAQAREVYEAIAGTSYDPSTFARDLRGTGLIQSTGDKRPNPVGRPARLYEFVSEEPAWGAGRRKRVG